MSQNPFDTAGAEQMIYAEPERTSIAAILSLVSSLICCIPIFPPIGILLGLFGLISTSKSGGRIGGKGFAVAGLILGIILTIIWSVLLVGLFKGIGAINDALPTATQVVKDIEAGDYDAARGTFITTSTFTDEQFAAFYASYSANLGDIDRGPDGIVEYFEALATTGQAMQPYQGRGDLIPIPVYFENDQALLLLIVDQGGTPPGPGVIIPIKDIWIIELDGTEHKLSEQPTTPIAPSEGEDPDPAGDSDSTDPDPGDDEESDETEPDDGP